MVTTSQIPEESNEPPEPHPLDNRPQSVCSGKPGQSRDLHSGDNCIGSPAAALRPETQVPPTVSNRSKEAIRQDLGPEGTSNDPTPLNNPVAVDYATAIATSTANQPKPSLNNTTIPLVSEADTSDNHRPYQGVDAHWFTPREVSTYLGANLEDGLSTQDAQRRLALDGPNKLESDEGVGVWRVLVRQVSNSLTLVLVIAMILSYATTDFIEGSVISAVILLNIVVGFFQDYRAEKTMQSLNSLSAPLASVIRDGQLTREKAEQLVVGDVVKISVGDIVPADLRLFDGMNLEIDEALLTGESLAVIKTPLQTMPFGVSVGVGDRTNMAFSSSTVTKGRAYGVVVKTGMGTEVGQIAALLRNEGPIAKASRLRRWYQKFSKTGKSILGLIGTPLQVKLSKFALMLFALAILLAIIVFSANKWQVGNEVLIYGICVAVAVIPESLIAVLTITMAVGTKTMAHGNVIVRKLQALEAVGGVTNICSDKTGTLTQGKMVARRAYIHGLGLLTVHDTTHPFDPTSGTTKHREFQIDQPMSDEDLGVPVDGELVDRSPQLEKFLNAIALCNLATVTKSDKGSYSSGESADSSSWGATGEPTEISLQVLAMRFGRGKQALLNTGTWNLVAEHPFDSIIKRMSVVYEQTRTKTLSVFTKGAGEVLVPTLNLSEEQKDELKSLIERMAGEGLRVLCIAERSLSNAALANDRSAIESGLNFVGLVGLYDPPRVETRDAVRKCQIAGVKVHMLTGDHIRTATAIAHEVGILSSAIPAVLASTIVMTAGQFDALSDAEIDALPQLPLVIARCSPKTKVRVVEALHRRGAFCVMTGDGVNDSPALKRADVGIAMGMNGSDVAKDASDLVLTDDNFASIVRAVEEGRRLFDNIQKFLMHLLISNISQVVLLLVGLAFRDENGVSIFPLSPLEILWVNMITSSFLALGLGLEEAQPDIMLRPPHDLRAGVFTREVIIDKMIYGVVMGTLCLAAFMVVVYGGGDGALGTMCNERFWEPCHTVYRARATVFAVLSFLLLLTAWEVKHFSRSLFNLDPSKYKGPFAVFHAVWYNRFLFWAVVAGFVITFPVIYIPVFNTAVFHHMAITWEWGIVWGCSAIYLAIVETWKAIKRRMGWGSGKNWVPDEDEDIEARIWEGFMTPLTREGTLIGTSVVTTRTNTLVDEDCVVCEK